MAKSTLSIKDIARAANVSHSTVSRALRHSHLVNPETAERIRQLASQANFRVSAVGRSLATGRTNSIGVVVTSIADPFTAEVVNSIEDKANARGYSVILANSRTDPDREIKVVRSFEERRVDGILVMSSRVGSLYTSLLRDMQIPIVLINSRPSGESVCSVAIDDLAAGETATRFLIHVGHGNIGYIGDAFGLESDLERVAGYRHALEAAGLPLREEYIVHGDGRAEGGVLAMEQLLDLPEPPTAVFCYNDMTAIGAMSAVHARRLSVPEDISVIGFDDLAIASFLRPTLTTIRQPKERMGQMATEILLSILHGSPAQPSRRVHGELIVRDSTAPPRQSTSLRSTSAQ